MKAEINSKQLRLRHPDVAFERADMSHGTVFSFLLTLACGLLFVHIALWGVFHYLGKPLIANHQTTNPIMTSNEELKDIGGDPALTFPKQTLQPNDVADLNKFRAAEEDNSPPMVGSIREHRRSAFRSSAPLTHSVHLGRTSRIPRH